MMRYFFGHGFAYPMMGFGGGWILWVIGALLVALIIIVVVRMARHPVHSADCHTETFPAAEQEESTALRILKERYAKGDITDEEFKTKKMNLL